MFKIGLYSGKFFPSSVRNIIVVWTHTNFPPISQSSHKWKISMVTLGDFNLTVYKNWPTKMQEKPVNQTILYKSLYILIGLTLVRWNLAISWIFALAKLKLVRLPIAKLNPPLNFEITFFVGETDQNSLFQQKIAIFNWLLGSFAKLNPREIFQNSIKVDLYFKFSNSKNC